MENYKVHLHTLPNGKRYVGITKQEPEKRWLNGKGYIQQDFRADIDFYGWENILHEIIADNLTEEQACEMEVFYIKKYDTLNEEKGYNKLLGRQGGYCKLGKSKQTFWQRIFGEVMFKKVQKYAKDRNFTIIAKRIVKGKIKSQEDLNCLLDSIEDVTDLQDIEDFIYDILY